MPIHGYPGNVITANPTAPTSSVASGVWTTEQQLIATAAGNWPFTIPTQQISRSLRFNSADTAYLDRTLGTSNRRTFTFSVWLKRSVFASTQCIFGNINYAGGGSTNQQFFLGFTGSDQLDMFHYNNGTQNQVTSSAVYRDPSAWYHIVGAVDTTQATSSNRLKIYVNGSQVTTLATATYPAQNTDTFINANLLTGIGRQVGTGIAGSYYNDGYLTEIYFIDGQALTPSSFGQTNASTGVWEPINYTGTYGTNGFYLNFSDNSGTTSTTLGKDYSGNGNNWTPNNFSVTAGSGNDSLVDSPTAYGTDTGVGGEVRGNYCTLNPLNSAGSTLSNGNLDCVTAVSGGDGGRGTIAVTSGKWYWEFIPTNNGNQSFSGIALTTTASGSYYVAYYANTGNKFVIGSGSSAYGATYTNNDVIGVALDLDSGTKTVTFYKNNASQGAITITPSEPVLPIVDDGSGSAATTFNCNFGQRAFAYTAPSGFKALCTQNLPTPTIGATSTTQAGKYFNPVIYTGTGSTRDVTGVGFSPDLVWVKRRSALENNLLANTISGGGKSLYSNLTLAEQTNEAGGYISAFVSDGFTVTAGSVSSTAVNASGSTYVAWNWKANGAGSSNTAGTITSTVSANTTAGFSISTYTGNGSSSQTVGHGLGVAPGMVIIKTKSNSDNWRVWHTSLTSGQTLTLNSTAGQAAAGFWPSSPSTSVVYLGTDTSVNSNTWTYVMYAFAPVSGYSAFGSFTGNGSGDGPFVFTNFRVRWLMIKRYDASGDPWWLIDAARSPYNQTTLALRPSASNAEDNGGNANFDFLSNGFKARTSGGQNGNESGATYIYAAFAESPFKYSLAR